jgi:4-aminobutyrate aminotransferase-like enzyme
MESVLQRRQRLLGSATLFYDQPIQIVRGDGVLLYDETGREYIDMYNNVPCVGHANAHVVEAMTRQMSTLNVHSRYLHEDILDYAQRLLALHHDGIENVIFACTGTEASEIALMTARAMTNGRGIICSDATYHGNSTEVRKMSRANLSNEPIDPDFRAIPFPQRYRPIQDDLDDEALCDKYLGKVREAIADFEEKGIPFAGMFVCSIFANEGLPDIPGNFMAKATDIVHDAGGLMIADEVQAGFCRSGDFWGYETSNFKPDIICMGKPMGNGLPLSAVAASADCVAAFRDSSRYFNTFASSPLQAAVGMAVLDEIENKDLLRQSAAVGEYLRSELKQLQSEHNAMGDVRGCGLFSGIEWISGEREADRLGAVNTANRLKEKGFLLSNAGALGNVLKVRPPLVFEQHHADLFLTAFRECMQDG